MTISGRRFSALLLALPLVAASQVTLAPAASAVPDYKHCDLYNSGGDHLTAYCTRKAAKTDYRVVIRCSNGKLYRGPWRTQGGTFSSTRYCPDGTNLRTGWRQLR